CSLRSARGRMINDETVRDTAVWKRIVLVGVTGALPLFVVALILIHVAYSGAIDFALQEQRGNALERPLERLLQLLPLHQLAARRQLAGESPPQLSLAESQRRIDDALAVVALAYDGEPGRRLGLSAAELGPPNRANASLSAVKRQWLELKRAPLPVVANGEASGSLLASLRAMIEHVGDRSNLILDDDLDSFYLMDITLCALPQTQQRLAQITSRLGDWLRRDQARANLAQIAAMAALLREVDLSRLVRDAHTSLSEDSHFNGASPSLQR